MEKIVLTGGPCAGKSSALQEIKARLARLNKTVYIVPEAATQILAQGWIPDQTCSLYEFQQKVFAQGLANEKTLDEFLKQNPVDYVLYDRGLVDGSAYIDAPRFCQIAASHQMTVEELYQRYDQVIFLESVSFLSADDYTYKEDQTSSNSQRMEDARGAQIVDENTRKVWSIHPRYAFVQAASVFEDKIQQVMDLIQQTPDKP